MKHGDNSEQRGEMSEAHLDLAIGLLEGTIASDDARVSAARAEDPSFDAHLEDLRDKGSALGRLHEEHAAIRTEASAAGPAAEEEAVLNSLRSLMAESRGQPPTSGSADLGRSPARAWWMRLLTVAAGLALVGGIAWWNRSEKPDDETVLSTDLSSITLRATPDGGDALDLSWSLADLAALTPDGGFLLELFDDSRIQMLESVKEQGQSHRLVDIRRLWSSGARYLRVRALGARGEVLPGMISNWLEIPEPESDQ